MTKDKSVESLRGLAIILVVTAHIVVAENSVYRYLQQFFFFIRMPLFTVISGYIYSLRPIKEGDVIPFIKKKARRILLPFLSVSTIQYITATLTPGTNNTYQLSDMYKIYIFFGLDQLWFLQAVFLIFVTIALIENYSKINTAKKWLIALTFSSITFFFLDTFGIFAINGYLGLLPFFILGIGLNRFKNIIFQKIVLIPIILTFIASIIIQQLNWFEIIHIYPLHRKTWLSLITGISSAVTFFYIKKPVNLLAKLGYYSYGIYLFHIFGTSGARIVLQKLFGNVNSNIMFFTSLICGLLFPIIIETIIEKNKYATLILLGKRQQSTMKKYQFNPALIFSQRNNKKLSH